MIRETIFRGLWLTALWLYCITFSSLVIGAVHEVKDGHSIQAAVAEAKAGDTIKVFPGTYRETIYVGQCHYGAVGEQLLDSQQLGH